MELANLKKPFKSRKDTTDDYKDTTDDYEDNFNSIFSRLNMEGYTYTVLEFDRYHDYCPYGFDVHVDAVKKHVLIEICTQNEVISLNSFWETVEEEINNQLPNSIKRNF